jgi:hypothetical protein
VIDEPQRPALPNDLNFEVTPTGYEIWFSDRISSDHHELVDEFGEWMEEDLGAVNLGQIDHQVLLSDGLLTDEVRRTLLAWWTERIEDLNQD